MSIKSDLDLNFEPLELRTKHVFAISSGSSSVRRNIVVTLKYGDLEGIGEAAPAAYHNETTATVLAVLDKFKKEKLLGNDPFAIHEVCERMDRSVAQNHAAKAAIEMAMHDLCGKLMQTPTFKLLGLAGLHSPMTDFTIGIDSLDVVESKTKEAVAAGYKILKVKQGTAYDKEIILQIRKIAPELPLRVDANGAWSPKQAVTMARFLNDHGVEFIEQPLPKFAHVDDWRFVKEHSPIPIFADESCCRSPDVARLAGTIDGVVVKLAKTGGLMEALKVIYTARAHGLKVMLGCMIESSLAVTAISHLSGLADYLDLDGAMLLADDPYLGAVYSDGYMVLNDKPGLGVTKR